MFIFGGAPVAMKDASGTWSDFIFANGQKIAMAQSSTNQLRQR
jgi:hypothetical protein